MFAGNAKDQPLCAQVHAVKVAGGGLVLYHDKGQIQTVSLDVIFHFLYGLFGQSDGYLRKSMAEILRDADEEIGTVLIGKAVGDGAAGILRQVVNLADAVCAIFKIRLAFSI